MIMAKLVSGLTLVLLLLAVGCSSQNELTQSDADISGTIIEVNEQDNQILIEQDNPDDPATKQIWISKDEDSEIVIGGAAESKFASSIKNKKAEVWIKNLIAQSSPPQAIAEKVIIE